MGIYKYRDERDYIHRKDHPQLEEGEQQHSRKGERRKVQQVRVETVDEQGLRRSQEEDEHQIEEPVVLFEYDGVGVEDRKEENQHYGQRYQQVAQPLEQRRAAVAYAVLIFRLVGIQDLLHLRGDQFALVDQNLAGVHNALGRGYEIHILRMHQHGGLVVEHQVRDYRVICAAHVQERIHIHLGIALPQVRQHLRPGILESIYVGGRNPRSPLVPLEKEYAGSHRIKGSVGDHSLGINVLEGRRVGLGKPRTFV